MLNLPISLNQQFDKPLLNKSLPDKDRACYKKWLRFYWDFCHKYQHDAFHSGSLPLFLLKLQDKNQSEQQQNLAKQAVSLFFEMHTESFKKLVSSYRIQMFEEVAKSNLAGLIFTYVWELDQKKDCDFIDHIVEIFEKENASVYYIELEANAEERLRRNKSANRLKHKPSKRNFTASEEELQETDRNHILNSIA